MKFIPKGANPAKSMTLKALQKHVADVAALHADKALETKTTQGDKKAMKGAPTQYDTRVNQQVVQPASKVIATQKPATTIFSATHKPAPTSVIAAPSQAVSSTKLFGTLGVLSAAVAGISIRDYFKTANIAVKSALPKINAAASSVTDVGFVNDYAKALAQAPSIATLFATATKAPLPTLTLDNAPGVTNSALGVLGLTAGASLLAGAGYLVATRLTTAQISERSASKGVQAPAPLTKKSMKITLASLIGTQIKKAKSAVLAAVAFIVNAVKSGFSRLKKNGSAARTSTLARASRLRSGVKFANLNLFKKVSFKQSV